MLRLRLLSEVISLRTAGATSPEAGLVFSTRRTLHLPCLLSLKLSTAMSPWQPRSLGTDGDTGLQTITGSRMQGGSVSPRLRFGVGSLTRMESKRWDLPPWFAQALSRGCTVA